MLIGQLKASGLRLAYHGDFDWAGIQIGNLMMSRFEAQPWCFGAADYLAPRRDALTGNAIVPAWDPQLAEAMRTRGRAVHEEAVLTQLLGALGAE